MKIKTAVNRIFWRFGGNGNKNPFPVNAEDVEAYNSIKEYVARAEKQQFQDNEAFAKLFIYIYQKILENDKSTVLDNQARKKICNLLKKPLSRIVDEFTRSLNDSEQYSLLNDLGIDLKHPALLSEQERYKHSQQLKEAIKTPENKKRLTGDVWETEFVWECLEAEVNQALNMNRE